MEQAVFEPSIVAPTPPALDRSAVDAVLGDSRRSPIEYVERYEIDADGE